MTREGLYLALFVLLAAVTACTPKQAPVAPLPTPQPSLPTTRLPTTSSLNPQDVAWAQVVEAAKKEGKVTAYTGLSFTGDVGPAVVDAFYKKYGIRAEIIAGPGAALIERIKTEQRTKAIIADVLDGSVVFSVPLLQEEQLAPLANELPVLREDAWLVPPPMDDSGHLLRVSPSYASPWINTDLVKPDEIPKSWADVLDARWRGKLLSPDPRTSAGADRYVHTLTKYKVVEPDFFPKLAAQKVTFPTGVGSFPPYVALAKGEGEMVIFGFDSLAAPTAREGGHIKPVVFREGVIGTSTVIQLIKNSPHPNAGKLFINFALSQPGYELVTTIARLGSSRKDVPDLSVTGKLKPFKIFANTIEDETQISKNMRDGVAAKALGAR